MPEIGSLELSGACRATLSGFDSKNNIAIELDGASSLKIDNMAVGKTEVVLSGASKIEGQIHAGDMDLKSNGASRTELAGSAKDLSVDASGASHLDLARFQAASARVKFKGATRGTINTSGRLDVDLSGASGLYTLGEPSMGEVKIKSASTLNKK